MPSNVKLTTAEFRAWRVNKAQWVSPDGYVLRAVTPEEERTLFPAIERTKLVGRTQSYDLTVTYKHEDPETSRVVETQQAMQAIIRITLTGRERHNYVIEVFVNGCRYVKGREIIEKRMLATHGECNLYGPNGKRLRVVRNPALRRPTYSESQRSAPHPDNCHCRGWKNKGDPSRHHAACNWNEKAPPNERALPFEPVVEPTAIVDSPEPIESLAFDPQSVRNVPAPVDRSRLPLPPSAVLAPGAPRPRVVSGPLQRPPTVVEPPVYAGVPTALPPEQPLLRSTTPPPAPVRGIHGPNDCPEDCRGVKTPGKAWRWPAGRRPERSQHHPLCPYDAGYRRKTRGDQVWMLYDLERQAEVREATVDEVTQSEVELSRSGTRSITIAGKIYAVVQSGEEKPAPPPPRPPAPQSHAEKRQAALVASRLPTVPMTEEAAATSEASLVARLEARIAELEGRTAGQMQVNAPPVSSLPIRLTPSAPVGQPADYLRNDLGLVGNQQATDDIAPGPVLLDEPEAFVDPLARAEEVTPSAPRRPVDYHPGGTRPKGFVPPPPPGAGPPVVAESAEAATEESPDDLPGEMEPDDAQGEVGSPEVDAEIARLIAEANALDGAAATAPAV